MTYYKHFRVLAWLSVAVLLACLAPRAPAADVQVNCPNGGGGTYPSITEALSAIGMVGPHTITVTGTCLESVGLYRASDITIQASAPGAAKIDGTPWDAIDIQMSTGITLINLELVGDPANGGGVVLYDRSEATLQGLNIHGTVSGVWVQLYSNAVIRNSNIHDNTQGDGIDVYAYSSVDVSGTTLKNNAGGLYATTHSRATLSGRNVVVDNGDVGLNALDYTVLTVNGNATNFSTIQGHNANGIQAAREALLVVNGPSVIQGNGAGCGPPQCGGIFIYRGGNARIFNAIITGNTGDGIAVDQAIDMRVSGTTITNNSGDGIRLWRMSIGDILTGPGTGDMVIYGNGGFAVSCDRTSLATGDLAGYGKLDCKNIERPNGQVRPGRAK